MPHDVNFSGYFVSAYWFKSKCKAIWIGHIKTTRKNGFLRISGHGLFIAKSSYLLFTKNHIHLRVCKMLQILVKCRAKL